MSPAYPRSATLRKSARPISGMSPWDLPALFLGFDVPDIITFVTSDQFLNRPNLYPRQGTLLKIIFLRDDLFTAYDNEVIDEWEQTYRETGNNGICPNIRQRITWLKALGYKWFREVLLVLGRRAGKGYVTALALSYILWHYMAKSDPQGWYGIDRDKKLALMVFAGKRDQAKSQVWRDVVNVVTGSACFAPYIGKLQGESLTVMAPNDKVRIRRMQERGIYSDGLDLSTFEIVPKESTLMAGRGPASFAMAFDEMAHVVASGANRSAEEVYCLDPMTRVLGSDLIWRPIKDLRVGDGLVSLDEYPERPGVQRKLREASVKGIKHSRSAPVRITFEDGTSVVCSENHRWFRVSKDCNGGRWVFAGRPPTRIGTHGELGNPTSLKVGDYIRHIVDPWEVDDTRDGGWLAGILDGEGWVSSPKTSAFKVGIAQNPGKVLDRTEELLKQHGFEFYRWNKHASRQSDCEQIEVRGIADTLRIIGQFRPERLLDKSKGLWEGKTPRGYQKHKRIVSIERLPEQDLIDIETTTGTFLAEGLVSHNTAATPSLDQFGKDGFIIAPSSPWQMTGQFYENYQHSIELDPATNLPVYNEMLMLQLTSWDIYVDWERAHLIPLFPEGYQQIADVEPYWRGYEDVPRYRRLRSAIQAYDDQMRRLEQASPDTFKVERRSHFATALDAYLNADKVRAMFQPWDGRPEQYGPPDLFMQESGLLAVSYKAHGDPSKSNANFGFALGHGEVDEFGVTHCVFDLIHHWEPASFPDGIINYDDIEEFIWERIIRKFHPEELTFDQWNSASTIQRLQKRVRDGHLPKRANIFEKTATRAYNWSRAETFKTALNMGWIHAPAYEQGMLELMFLSEQNGVVDHPTAGPIQTKDVADCLMEVVMVIVGEQVNNFLHADLKGFRPAGMMEGGVEPFGQLRGEENEVLAALSGFSRARGERDPMGLSRGRRRR